MLRFALAFLIAALAAATLGLLQAENWPSVLFFVALAPFLVIAAFIMTPAIQRRSRHRRARRAAH